MNKENKQKGRSPAFQFYADDFLAGTITMTNEEKGAYISLLCIQWSRGFLSETDFQRVCAGMPSHSVGICQGKFQVESDGTYRNKRLEAERTKQKEYSQKQRNIANLRWNKDASAMPAHMPDDAIAMPEDMPKVCSPSPSPKEDTYKAPSLSQELEAFRLRIGSWFKRRPETRWSDKEIKLLKEAFDSGFTVEELDLLEQFYKSDSQYKRRDIKTLLNNWNTEIDRAKGNMMFGDDQTHRQPQSKRQIDWRDSL